MLGRVRQVSFTLDVGKERAIDCFQTAIATRGYRLLASDRESGRLAFRSRRDLGYWTSYDFDVNITPELEVGNETPRTSVIIRSRMRGLPLYDWGRGRLFFEGCPTL